MKAKIIAAAAVGTGILVALYLRRRKKALTLPITLTDAKGDEVTIRVAVAADRDQVASSIADHTGTGSGNGGDDFLIQEFDRMVGDPGLTLMFVDDANGKGLGMMAVAWSSPTESYWQSLRIATAARGRGVAKLLFQTAARLAVERQGDKSISRWGIVSNNTIMIDWSNRLKLHGPQAFRRHGAKPSDEPPPLPEGYTLRALTPSDDLKGIMKTLETFPVAQSEYGTQNFVVAGWADFSESLLKAGVAGETSRGIPMPAPRALYNADGKLVAFAALSVLRFGENKWMMHRYADGPELEILLHCMPHLAKEVGAEAGCGGYVPCLPSVLEIFEKSKVFARMTETEQHEFHWTNKDYVNV